MNNRLKAAGMLTLYVTGLFYYYRTSNHDIDSLNERFDAHTSIIAAYGSTGTGALINLTPQTVVDNNYFNLDAHYIASHDLKVDLGHKI